MENDKIIKDYNKVKYLDTPKNNNNLWDKYIHEKTQSIEQFMNINISSKEIPIIPNHKEFVILYFSKKSLEQLNDKQILVITECLRSMFNVSALIGKNYDVINEIDKLKKTCTSGGFWKTILSPLNKYIIGDGKRKLNDHEQYSAEIILEALSPENVIITSWISKIDTEDQDKIIAIIDNDIYNKGTQFVFGATKMNGNESVISTYYLKDNALLLKIILHEFGHSIGIEHCKKHTCLFNGIISLEELENHPIAPCLECCAKIAFATGRTLIKQLISINNVAVGIDHIVKSLEILNRDLVGEIANNL